MVDGKNQQVRLHQLQPLLRENAFHPSQPHRQQQQQTHQELFFFFFVLLFCNLIPQNPWPHVGPDPTHTHTQTHYHHHHHHPTTEVSLSAAPTPAIPSNPRSDPIRIRFGPHFSSSVGSYWDQLAGSEFGEGEAGGESGRFITETWKVCATASQAGVCG